MQTVTSKKTKKVEKYLVEVSEKSLKEVFIPKKTTEKLEFSISHQTGSLIIKKK